ncbi:hypothetical protein NUU61_005931 [Penicillium alfredii]|uniref:Zn(2)-C6 fungal-type domain-containing protein n=1 Tax=Penicillium alfredii TaxID=1506179 RepID=A0A9W9F019_9EURO|nr:uncharacterized protein NUU61_005931 [Penicillium alfredii]KAJ5091061.1 hypothetical protein NUU61_005931 [Penicillium alfredii]
MTPPSRYRPGNHREPHIHREEYTDAASACAFRKMNTYVSVAYSHQHAHMKLRRPMKKGKKACTECRQQKAKCDVYLNPEEPCTRCRKVGARCVISDPFKREHKRKRLSELEQESEELRQKIRSSQDVEPHPSPIALLTAAAEMEGRAGPAPASLPTSSDVPPISHSPNLPLPALQNPGPELEGADLTQSRMLDGTRVTGEEIDDMFTLFFKYYAQFLPILDPRIRPNTYYSQSPFLFWSVIGVSCRAYPRNPTLLMALARSITEMAFLSVLSPFPSWHTIQGFLLLLTWPFPKENRSDVIFPMSGMLLHIAMQNGLHIPMSSHEFSRVKMPAPSEADMTRRSELWAHVVVVYQRTSVIKGQSPRVLMNMAQDPAQRHVLLGRVAPFLALKLRCQELIARCSEAVLENGVRSMSLDQERALDILLRTYESQVDDLELQAVTDDDKFHTSLCRMAIQSFHFYKSQTMLSTACLPRLMITACDLIDYIQALGSRLGFLVMAPVQIGFGLLLASTSLLRILKSPMATEGLETVRARSSFFLAINLAQQMSVERTDLAAKTVTILTQLWNSSKVFRKADGSEYTGLRIRSRLVLSHILDTVWWWRDEFDPQSRAVVLATEADPGSLGSGGDLSRDPGGAQPATFAPDRQEPVHLDEQFLADFEWALGDDALLSMEPLSMNWSTNLL